MQSAYIEAYATCPYEDCGRPLKFNLLDPAVRLESVFDRHPSQSSMKKNFLAKCYYCKRYLTFEITESIQWGAGKRKSN